MRINHNDEGWSKCPVCGVELFDGEGWFIDEDQVEHICDSEKTCVFIPLCMEARINDFKNNN